VSDEGKYLYGVIATNEERNFGPIGIGGRGDEVGTIAYGSLSAVVSNSPMTRYVVSQENLLAHERVIERVMQERTILPARFCTIAVNAEDIRRLLQRRYRKFGDLLRYMDHKIELGVKVFWRDMAAIFREIVDENEEIRRLKEKIAQRPPAQTRAGRIAVGRKVQGALDAKKEREVEQILAGLRRASVEYRLNRTVGDKMLLNAAFLVDRGHEKEFDDLMETLDLRCRDRMRFAYVGPLAPYNFVNITLHPDE
jgi:hypothetical protein